MNVFKRLWQFVFPPPLEKNAELAAEEARLDEAKEACRTLLMEAVDIQQTSQALPALSTGVLTEDDLAGLRERLRKEAEERKAK